MIITVESVLFCAVAVINSWATFRIIRDDLSSRLQKAAQITLVWVAPLLGALLIIHLLRQNAISSARTKAGKPPQIEDLAFTSGPGLTYSESGVVDSEHE
ncbi:MAG: hypothetical protein V4568_16395 [Pseudomonadota bacterium]